MMGTVMWLKNSVVHLVVIFMVRCHTVQSCGGTLTKTSGWFTSPGYPGAYKSHTKCDWLIRSNQSGQIQLHFTDIRLARPAYANYIQLFDGISPKARNITTFINFVKPDQIFESTSNALYISFRTDDNSQSYRGFNASYQVKSCPNKKETRERGIIYSPSYPQFYPDNDCMQWSLDNIEEGGIVTISFSKMDIKPDADGQCNGDYIMFGPVPLSKKICGTLGEDPPPVYISTHNPLIWIKFNSNNQNAGRGFVLTYIIDVVSPTVSPLKPCAIDEFKCNNSKCIYDNWHCNGADECGDNSDEIDCKGRVTAQPSICGFGKFGCISNETQEFSCLWNFKRCDNVIHCQDGSDEEGCNNTSQCGAVLEKAPGYFTTPNYPKKYPHNFDCEWLILVEPTKKVQLRFKDFDLENNVLTDYIKVYDGKNAKAPLIGQYYGEQIPPNVIDGSKSELFVTFHSDKSSSAKGFNATYQVKGECLPIEQAPCKYGEDDCYAIKERCDGVWNCKKHGGDERGCGACVEKAFACSPGGSQCYSEAEHCNGLGHCYDSRDEQDCNSDVCGPHNGTFLCRNRKCIYESWHCDGTNDCSDGSDEENCSGMPSVRVITAAVVGSLVCCLLLVIAFGCTCKLYAMRLQEQHGGPRYQSPLTRYQIMAFNQRPVPPTYDEAMQNSRSFDDVQREYVERARTTGRRGRRNRGQGRQRSRDSQPIQDNVSPGDRAMDNTQRGNGVINDGFDSEGLPSGSDNPQGAEAPPRGPIQTLFNIHPPSLLDSDDGSVQTSISVSRATGVTAEWHRHARPKNAQNSNNSAVVPTSNDPGIDGGSIQSVPSRGYESSDDSVLLSLDEDDKDLNDETSLINISANSQTAPSGEQNRSRTNRQIQDGGTSDGDSIQSESMEMSGRLYRNQNISRLSISSDVSIEDLESDVPLLLP
ncbi:unnamed protein product [Owenia fusiformis]|uniref:Uncharacterized protein n=1 Tax=Owenia fusiformis TaxID=6347 RepID=A0A8J1XSS3_OWEFU|nr:unnamed protein product [Owenia fusiformis]